MSPPDDHEVTRLLHDLNAGVDGAADRLAEVIYAELHRLAEHALRGEVAGHTLQPTDLVHEAFTRLIGQDRTTWHNRSQFYGLAAQAIRRLLIDHARRRRARKRDHGIRVTLTDAAADAGADALDLIALDQALQHLDTLDPRAARVVELRYFAGLEVEEVATTLEISPATVKRDWTFARAFLLKSLDDRGTTA
jgi:RNA polymerase sigma factor (TIGR02999 family)